MSLLAQLSTLRGRYLWRSFQAMTTRPEEVQRQLLGSLLAINRDTAFGKTHDFANMVSEQDYQQGVPVADYEATRPWVERLQAGERRVLTTDEPHMFTMTSGTTGQPKLIPVTGSTRRGNARLSAKWLYRCLVDHPRVLDNKALVIASPAVEGHTPSGLPFGSASGYIYENASRALRYRYAVPYDVFAIKDFDAKYYAIMRFAIAQRISLLATPNPSTIIQLVNAAYTRRDQLVRDLWDGTLTEDVEVLPEIRRALRPHLKPNPRRARELERLASSRDTFTPQHYWPELALVGCWKGGSVGATLNRIRPLFSQDTPFRDIGYLSSEASATLCIQDEGCAGILSLDTNYYEFIPEGEIDSASARPVTVGQVEVGESYYIVITSPAGLYRYDINDVLKVTGFFRETPLVEFVRKGRDMVSLTGEKLHVAQLIQAVEKAQLSVGLKLAYYRAVGNVEASRYDLKLELAQEHASDELLVALGRNIDEELAKLNIEYDQKRGSGRLYPPHVQVMSKGWSAKRIQAKMARAGRDTQFKDAILGLSDEDDFPSDVIKDLST